MISKKLTSAVPFCFGLLILTSANAGLAETAKSYERMNSSGFADLQKIDVSNEDQLLTNQPYDIPHRCAGYQEHLRLCSNKPRIRLGLRKHDCKELIPVHVIGGSTLVIADVVEANKSASQFIENIILYGSMRLRI